MSDDGRGPVGKGRNERRVTVFTLPNTYFHLLQLLEQFAGTLPVAGVTIVIITLIVEQLECDGLEDEQGFSNVSIKGMSVKAHREGAEAEQGSLVCQK